ncbi:MAG: bifunctional homocysteine S-methyltransferase/methylenetetrahydrofolate reductase [Chloroflexi bacterium]|nr:bifunctional homocysteine S-methyltransferase/methylenetetrahydrofolate reductase [Chloroflexota bacterium]MCH8338755.1 bifunctional homocysteine S-methyltransferase/methylenetetrahydrofolate reductase [Chloroflexota bacterium]MCH8340511.1 bifunctional homocysteine S-methyltransferase/methylenetetrahydrofolate reductase [Chloroflexota bacterium]MCH8876087.1 bifunctional homocysteine S-methyltransferase/methylenetetrahydrofolate reductase [Chloroflexota bacterium]MDK1044722.1 bifunctional hom
MSNRVKFLDWLASGEPILADGAMGTQLHARGIPFEACFDELNLSRPELILDIHQEYLQAGARIIEANTFGANRHKLSSHGLEHQVEKINAAGVALAKQAIEETGADALVAGSVGPLGVRMAPFGRVKREEAYEAFKEQITALEQAGADLISLETQSDLYELREGIQAAKVVGDLPVIASVTYTRDDRTLLGDTPAQAARLLWESGADVVGANCSGGPAQLLRVLQVMRRAVPEGKFSVMPNAGWPEQVGGRIMYAATADYFAEYARAYTQAGACIIGGCCGTTPEHIAHMRTAIEGVEVSQVRIISIETDEDLEKLSSGQTGATHLSSKFASGQFVLSVEVNPPRGLSVEKLLAGARLLAAAGADVINVADSPMARMRMSPWAVCHLVQDEVGLETVLHFPTRGRNLLRVQGDLLAAHATGVRNIFVVMGDPTSIGDYPEATDNYDVVPSGLIKLIKHGFNAGVDHHGDEIGEATSFYVGCALNLDTANVEQEIRVLRRKIEAGADFVLTQPVFEPQRIEQTISAFEERYGPLGIPVLVGILPLYGIKHARFLHNEVPGISIPEAIQKRVSAAGDRAPQAGVSMAIEIIDQLKDSVAGAYLLPPFNRYDMAAEIIESVAEKMPAGGGV